MDARAFVALMDNSLVYTDYDGILEAKAAGQCEAADTGPNSRSRSP